MSEGVYECSYQPRRDGPLSVSVRYAGEPVARSPYEVRVGAISGSMMRARGPGLQNAVARLPATFSVHANDDPGTLGMYGV